MGRVFWYRGQAEVSMSVLSRETQRAIKDVGMAVTVALLFWLFVRS